MPEEEAYTARVQSKLPDVKYLWLLGFLPHLLVGIGCIVMPEVFYDRFVWKYFYGPIVADSNNVASLTRHGVTAYPGYTIVSEIGYAYTLAVSVYGVWEVLKRFEIATSRRFFYAMVPYVFAGGSFRVIEDTGMLSWPLEFFVISPMIYLTMFAITGGLVAVSLWLERNDVIDDYTVPTGVAGVVWMLFTSGVVLWYGLTETVVRLWIIGVVVAMATIITGVTWFGVKQTRPTVFEGTGGIGAVILWGHLIDGSATTVGIEYLGYIEKHPVVQAIINMSGTTYTFILVKLVVVLFLLSLFKDDMQDDSPQYTYLLLVAILAVGLGPGTRDLMRAVIGV